MSRSRFARALLSLCAFAALAAGASQHVYIAGIGGNAVTIIDTTAQAVVGQSGSIGSALSGIAVNGDGSHVFAASLGAFSPPGVWDMGPDGSVTNFLSVPAGELFGLAFDTAANRLYAAATSSIVQIDPTTHTIVNTLAAGSPYSVLVNPASTTGRLYYSDQANNAVVVVSSSFAVTTSIPVGARPQGMALDPSGTRLYVANADGDSVSVISTATNTVIQTVSLAASSAPIAVVVDPTGTNWYVAESGRNHVEGFSVATNAAVLDVAVGNTPTGIDVDAAGRLYVPNQFDNNVTVIQPGATPSTHNIAIGVASGLPLGIGRFIGPGTPDPPTGVAAVPGDTQATVSFSPPASDGGKPITSYTATCGTQSASAAASPIVVAGLVDGTTVDCTVTATNAIGTSGPSSPAVSVTPATAPGAPTIVAATPGTSQATVAFTAPAFDGGSPIISYVATCGSQSATSSISPIVVTGLANGTQVACTVTASNAVTSGPASAPVNVTPATAPGAPTIVAATPGISQATVAFTAPAFDGGSPIIAYTATCGSQSVTGSASPIVVAGLANGTQVACTVTASNAVTSGPASAPVSVTPAAAPGPPTNVTATAGNSQLTLAFTAPAFDGGSPVILYTATCGSQSATGGVSPIVVAGLANGTQVACTVTASNAVSTSVPSSPVSAIPAWRSFTGPVATGLGSATASVSGGGPACTFAPQGTGPLESAFFIPVSGSPKSPPGTAPLAFPFGLFDFVLLDCAPGSTVTFTIIYPAAIPAGTRYMKYGPTASQPAPHWYELPASLSGNTATFSITDGGLGDDDLVANGTIVDQGGPGGAGGAGSGADPVPTLSEWALFALALGIVLATATGRRARRGR